MTGVYLIAELEEVATELGEPDCKLVEPYVVQQYKNGSDSATFTFTPWLLDVTTQNEMMISSDKILTIVAPSTKIITAYEKLFD